MYINLLIKCRKIFKILLIDTTTQPLSKSNQLYIITIKNRSLATLKLFHSFNVSPSLQNILGQLIMLDIQLWFHVITAKRLQWQKQNNNLELLLLFGVFYSCLFFVWECVACALQLARMWNIFVDNAAMK